jgi:hypothetical protein
MSGSAKSTTSVPAWQNRAAQDALRAANRVANMKFTPYYGADVAAMTPAQMAAYEGTNQAASAFGTPTADPMAGMPTAKNFNGTMAYSSGGMYDQALAELKRRNPRQYNALMAQFMPERARGGGGGGGGGGGNRSRNRGNDGVVNAGTGAGFISLLDMFDGGGAGQSGSTFSGGPLSGTLNNAGVQPPLPR